MTAFQFPFRLPKPKTLLGQATAVLIVSFLLLGVTWIVTSIVVERRLAAAMQRAEAEFGFSNDINDYIPTILPTERNAMVPLDEAAALVAPLLQGLPFWNWTDDAESRLASVPTLATSLRIEAIDRLLDEADRRPECSPAAPPLRPWIEHHYAPHAFRRFLFEGEALVSWLLVKDGRRDEAVRRLLRILRVSRKWTTVEPYFGDLSNDLSRRRRALEVLNDLLRKGPIDRSLHDAIDAEMVEQEKCKDLLTRLYQLEKLKRLEDFEANPFRRRAWWLVGPLADNDRLLIVDWYDLLARHSKRPLSEAKPELEAATAELRRISMHPFDSLVHPDALGVISTQSRLGFDYLVAQSRCMRIVNAMARNGRWDAELKSLSLPPDCLIDPINLQPMLLTKTPSGPIVYSVGYDLVDDGGTFQANNMTGIDIGFWPLKKQEASK